MTTILRHAPRHASRILIALTGILILVSGRGSGRPDLLAQVNPIVAENQLLGDTDWDISGSGSPSIQGFATEMSVNVGQTVQFKIATPSTNYRLDIYRLGYYNGAGARKVHTISNTDVIPQTQPACQTDTGTGLVDCGNWGISASWAVPSTAVSGVYVAKAVRQDVAGTSHIYFIVRDDSRAADILFQTADTTWQAYNLYGGNSLYCGAPYSNAGTAYGCAGRAVKVSYNRPIDTRDHDPQSFLFNAEYPMLRFLEANGYNVKYWSGVDTDRFGANPAIGLTSAVKPKIFLSVGHDEYWSGAQRTAVENARNAGVNLSFMSGNEVYWKTRWEPAITGSLAGHRTLVSYKETLASAKIDPSSEWTGTWRDPRFSPPSDGGRPENALIGSIWTVNCCAATIEVPASMSGLRFWRNTRIADLAAGQTATLAPGVLGYEWGEALENGFQPAGLVRMSSTTIANVEKIIDYGSRVGYGTATHSLTLYRHNSGALVFGASTVQWAWGLDGQHDDNTHSPISHQPDQAIQQATVNLFADMGAQPSSLQTGADGTRPLVTSPPTSDIYAPTSTITSPAPNGTVESGNRITIYGTAADNGGGAVGAVEVSVDGGTTWRKAAGTSSWSIEWTPGVVGTANIKSRATDDTGNLETAGPGTTVSVIVGDCPCESLWKASVVPGTASAADNSEYELGVKFRSDVDGFITGIRFYKGPANNGTHVGNLWTSTGTLLGSAIFTNETATGWQKVSFPTPVPITANTIYVASYHTPNGGYAFDGGFFSSAGVDSPPLHALASGVSGGNGVFAAGPMSFPTNTFGAANYWVDVVFAQSLDDAVPPVVSNINTTTIDGSRVTVRWTTNEAATTRMDYGTDSSILTATLATLPAGTTTTTVPGFATQHTLQLGGLVPNTTYYFLATSIDAAGNATTVAAPSFTVPGPTLRDTALTDFGAGTATATYVSQTADGEVILAPVTGAEFSGPGLSTGWISTPWDPSGTAEIVDGILLVDGARVASCVTGTDGVCLAETVTSTPSAIYTAPKSLEFSANFSGDQFQHAGFAVTFGSASEPWAIFSTLSGGMLFARTNTGNGAIDTPIGVLPLGEFHRYRIDWNPDSMVYYVDGVQVASHAVALAGPMRPVAASDFNPFGGIVFVDWMRLLPNASPGVFESRVFDATTAVDWKAIQWAAHVPAGTALQISVRTGGSAVPDSNWTAWMPIASAGPLNLNSRFIQYRADMSSSLPNVTPELQDVIITTGNAPVAVADFASVPQNGMHTFPASGPGSLIANDSDPDAGNLLRVVSVTAPSHGAAVVNADGSVSYVPATNYNGPDAFVYTVTDGLLTASATVTLDVRFGNIAPVTNGDFYAVNEDSLLIVPGAGVLGNDTDVENDPLSAVLLTLPLHGTLTFNSGGSFTYAPNLNYAGPDSFTYRAHDGTDGGNTATVSLLVNQVNDPPLTVADSFVAMLNQPLDLPAPGVLANDRDVEVEDTAPLTARLITGPSHGLLTLRTDGSFSYVPHADFLGSDSFTYAAVDRFGAVSLAPATVTLTIALKAVSADAVAGGVISTGTGVSAADPLNSTVTTPTSAMVSIAQGVIAGSTSPSGYSFLNQQVNITVTNPDGTPVVASPANPLVFTFEVDLSLVPAGQTKDTFQVFRNNVLVPNCLGSTTIPAANFDPCVSGRENGTRIKLTILTTRASFWNMGVTTASLGGSELVAFNDGPYLVNFATPIAVPAPGVMSNDFGGTQITAQLVGTPVGGTVVLTPSGAFTFTPAAGHCGPASFQYRLLDGTTTSAPATASFTVNCTPIAVPDSVSILEDSGVTAISVLANDSDPDMQTFTVTAVTQGANGTVLIGGSGTFVSYQPVVNFFGSDSFTYTITDSRGDTATGTVNVNVLPVNDAPSFMKGANQTSLEDGGLQNVTGWATALSVGPGNESSQALSFATSNDNAALFTTQPSVAPNGTLGYQAAPDAFGVATVTVSVSDSGGTANGGADTSAAQTFTIAVTGVNDAPSFTKGADQSMLEDTGAQTILGWATNLSAGPVNETGQLLDFLVGSTNLALFTTPPAISANGTLTYDPAPNANGTATVTVRIRDNGGVANGGVDTSVAQTFMINVSLLNDPPSFTAGANQAVNEDAGAQSVPAWATGISAGPADEADQAVSFAVVSNSNAALFSDGPVVAANGTLTYTPAADAFGTATISLRASDNGGTLNGGVDTSAAQTFTITINPVNDAPAFVKGADQSVLEDSGPQTSAAWATGVSAGPANESGQLVAFTVVSNSNAALFSAAPAVAADGTLTYTPAADAFGTATISVRTTDNGGTLNGGVDTSAPQSFTITIAPVNDNPIANPDSATVLEDSGVTAIDVLANDNIGPDVGETLTVTAVTQPARGSVAFTATAVTYTPNANANGTDTFTYSIGDGNGGSATAVVTVTVTAVNDNPTIADDSAILSQGSDAIAINVLANDSSAPDGAETLTITAVTQGAHGTVAIVAGATAVTYTPAAGYSGPDTFSYTVSDGNGGSATGTVSVTVTPPPSLRIENTSVVEGNSGFTNAVFPVTLSSASTATVTASYQTFTGSARDGRDYVSTNGTVTFNPGETAKSITVLVIGETQREKDETFSVRLSAPVNVTIARAEGIGIIVDDDSTPQASVMNTTTTTRAKEGDTLGTSSLTFKVTLSNTSEIPLSVDYSTQGLTATPGVDYENTSGTLTFGEDETVKYITIPIKGDRQHEALERVRLHLGNAIELILNTTEIDGEIEDDDPAPSVSVQDVTVVEGAGGTTAAVFTVTLSEAAGTPETVGYQTADGTATAGSDYTAVSGTLTFETGVTSMTVTVPIIGDVTIEPSETFSLNLSSSGSDVTIARGQATATIVNDDSSTWVSGTLADLVGGTLGTGAYVAQMSDGAVILQPRSTAEFDGATLPAGWTKSSFGTVTVTGGVALIDGAQVQDATVLYGNQTLEFEATFNGASQYVGTALLRFVTKADGYVYAITLAPRNATVETVIPANLLGSPHRYRIDWYGTTITYSVDGTVVAVHTAAYPNNTAMMPLGGDLGAGVLVLDWVRVTPYAPSGEFTSAVFDAGQLVTWNTASWVSELPAGTALSFQVRVGAEDGTWTPFTSIAASGGAIAGGAGRYAQYRVVLTTTAPGSSPALKDVAITYTR